ncbi:uncharacterized protein A1O9_11170 [Exophiala aquamarina CBS 119918]|uniref:3-oxoacyl-[acyl-carrier protein] reductase n=1 Tax=Exophiala aquamarina CBS 119918 TaxID=1182545 RepID=A0A072P0G3_9EURO|nr:uncharacterized protein A1O9_11170 [Exophiala aquamarina CBS 119918]KEF52753.1 hypothetical protein A1O9_11170 [Exophiala aquamarina CBS 119918]
MRPGICQGRRSGVALLDHNTDALEQVKSELEREAGQERHGCQVLVYQVNVADKTAVTTAVESAAGVFDHAEAGLPAFVVGGPTPPAAWSHRQSGLHLRRRWRTYVNGLLRTAAVDYASRGLRINAVCPGYVDMPLIQPGAVTAQVAQEKTQVWTPMRRFGTAAEIADAVVFLSGGEELLHHGLGADGGWGIHFTLMYEPPKFNVGPNCPAELVEDPHLYRYTREWCSPVVLSKVFFENL